MPPETHSIQDQPNPPALAATDEWPRVFLDDDWLRVVPAPGAGGRSIQYRQLAAIMANDDTWQALIGLLMEARSAIGQPAREHDCGHTCCDERHDPLHDHFLAPGSCPACVNGTP